MSLKSTKWYRNRHGELFPVAGLCKKSPNWRIELEDGRTFLIDPSSVLEVEVRGSRP
jgi:hypothetical protein